MDGLTPEELDALRSQTRGMMKPVLPDGMAKRLMMLRLIDQKLGGYMVTAEGYKRLKTGR